MTQTTTIIPGVDALKSRLKAMWEDGNYDYFSRFMESNAVEFFDRLNLPAGISLLDVACGSGQLALIAARRGARVTGVDIAANLIRAARGRARSEGIDARFNAGVPLTAQFVIEDHALRHSWHHLAKITATLQLQ
jgi:2-polyprenyl-3-methyl-5-hydroxy-6-metoxy-1,4-benzoquinol methylase